MYLYMYLLDADNSILLILKEILTKQALKEAQCIDFDLLLLLFCSWCFLSGSVQNRSRGVQAEEAEGGAGLLHVTAGGVLLRPSRCRRYVLN